jgi:hypothetical protein
MAFLLVESIFQFNVCKVASVQNYFMKENGSKLIAKYFTTKDKVILQHLLLFIFIFVDIITLQLQYKEALSF